MNNKIYFLLGTLISKTMIPGGPVCSEYAEVNLSSFNQPNGGNNIPNNNPNTKTLKGILTNGKTHSPPEPYATVTLRLKDQGVSN